MTDASQYPTLAHVFGGADTSLSYYLFPPERQKGHAELHSLLTSNAVNAQLTAEWEAKYHALKAQQPKVERKLREVKIGGFMYRVKDGLLESPSIRGNWITVGRIAPSHAAEVADLFANPYEPVETVEEVLRRIIRVVNVGGAHSINDAGQCEIVPPRPEPVACNRKACRVPLSEPRWWNTSTRAYYCDECMRAITRFPENAHIFEDRLHPSAAAGVPVVELDEWCVVDKDGKQRGGSDANYGGANWWREQFDKASDARAPHRVMRVCLKEVNV